MIGTRSHPKINENETKRPAVFALIFGMMILSGAAADSQIDTSTGRQGSPSICVLSVGNDREARIENCGEGQTVSSDGTIHFSKPTLKRIEEAISKWNKKEKLDFKKSFPISFPAEKSASPLMFGPRLGYLLKTENGLLVRQVAFFDNGADYFEESLARFVARDGKIGFLDEKLKTVIPARFDFATPFSGGYSVVCTSEKMNPCVRIKSEEEEHSTIAGGSWAVIDQRGKVIKGPGLTQADAYKFASNLSAKSKTN